jgi:hypothetical protein
VRPDDGKSTHPSWAQRLAALGYVEAPEIEPIRRTALSTLLNPDTAEQQIAAFNSRWIGQMEDYLQR